MKKVILFAAAMMLAAGTASAQFGVFTPSETKTVKDPVTGIQLKVLTNTDKNDKFIYQTDPMWTPDGKYLLFRSSDRGDGQTMTRTTPDGREIKYKPTQYYFIEVASGKIIQATDGQVGSVFLANKSDRMFLNRVENGEWTDAIDVMNSYIKGTGYQYKLENSKPVLVASNTNTPEVSGLTQRVLDVARTLGL